MTSFSRRRFLLASLSVTGAGAVLAACAQKEENAKNAVATGQSVEIYAPDGELYHFIPEEERGDPLSFGGESVAEDGAPINLSDFTDQIVVVNAWGQWCAPCRTEVDDLQRVHEKLQAEGKGTVLGINVRDYNPEIVRDFIADNGMTYPSIYDPPFKTAVALGNIPPSVIPSTVVLDAKHRQAAVFIRPIEDKELLEVIDKL